MIRGKNMTNSNNDAGIGCHGTVHPSPRLFDKFLIPVVHVLHSPQVTRLPTALCAQGRYNEGQILQEVFR